MTAAKTTRKRRTKKAEVTQAVEYMKPADAIQELQLLKTEVDWSHSMVKEAAVDSAINALSNIEWTPCKKRIPEKTGMYYVTVLINDVGLGVALNEERV